MIIDTNLLDSDRIFTADVCLVGAGAAGITIARHLMGSGLQVCIVESGGMTHEAETQALYAGTNRGQPMEMDVGRYRIFGGSTSRWTGRCAPLDPADFVKRDWIPHSGWPITFDDVAPFYADAQLACGFHSQWPIGTAPDTLDPEPSDADPFSWRYPGRSHRGQLHFGRLHRRELDRSPTTIVLTHANLVGFEAEGDVPHVRTVVARSLSGRRVAVAAKAFALCCGGIENARILLNSTSTVPGGLGTRHDTIGRYFMQHTRGTTASVSVTKAQGRSLQARFNVRRAGRKVQHEHGFAMPFTVQREQQVLNASAVLTYRGRPASGWEAGKRLASGLRERRQAGRLADLHACLRDAGEIGRNVMWQRSRGMAPVFADPLVAVVVDLEQAPDPDSRIVLSPKLDRLGNHEVVVDWRISEMERQTARVLTELVAADLGTLGLGETTFEPWLSGTQPLTQQELVRTHHHIGTTRMAADPRYGVVDAECRVHGTSNLYVAGCSVFPTGGHANPTLTIVALALRLSSHLKASLQRSDRATSVAPHQAARKPGLRVLTR